MKALKSYFYLCADCLTFGNTINQDLGDAAAEGDNNKVKALLETGRADEVRIRYAALAAAEAGHTAVLETLLKAVPYNDSLIDAAVRWAEAKDKTETVNFLKDWRRAHLAPELSQSSLQPA